MTKYVFEINGKIYPNNTLILPVPTWKIDQIMVDFIRIHLGLVNPQYPACKTKPSVRSSHVIVPLARASKTSKGLETSKSQETPCTVPTVQGCEGEGVWRPFWPIFGV